MDVAVVIAVLLGIGTLIFAGLLTLAARRERRQAPNREPLSTSLPPLRALHGTRGVVVAGEIYDSRFWTAGPRFRRRVGAIEGPHAVLEPLDEDAARGAQTLRLTADELLSSFCRVEEAEETIVYGVANVEPEKRRA